MPGTLTLVALCLLIIIPKLAALRLANILFRRTVALPAPDLWHGETLKDTALVWLSTTTQRLRVGWLYLTDLRLIWAPAPLLGFGMGRSLPAPEPVRLRLSRIQEVDTLPTRFPFWSGIVLQAYGERFVISFVGKHALFADAGASRLWFHALKSSASPRE